MYGNKQLGRPAFQPTQQQKIMVEAMVGYGIPAEKIAPLIFDSRTGKPISESTLWRHFKQEMEGGATKLDVIIKQFAVTSILGREAPPGANFVPLLDERARYGLTDLYLRSRGGWKPSANAEQDKQTAGGGPILIQISAEDGKL